MSLPEPANIQVIAPQQGALAAEDTPIGWPAHEQASAPLVSVIIPVRNEVKHIRQCLEYVIGQTYPSDRMEILVVDGMSIDGTRELVGQIAAQSGRHAIRLLDNPVGQRAPGLNRGIAKASGEVIARVDGRTVLPPEYIERCVAALLAHGADNVGGSVKPVSQTPVQTAVGLAMYHPFGVGNAQFRVGKHSGPVDSVYLGCFRKSVFEKVGLFDESVITEDSDLNFRIRQAGGVVYLDTGIHVYYSPREHLLDLWNLYTRYGGYRAGFMLKHRRLTSWRQLAPPAFVLMLAGLIGLSFVTPWARGGLLGLITSYLLVDSMVAAALAHRQGDSRVLLPLLFAFPLMHVGWGLGFLRRLMDHGPDRGFWLR